jgi:hypothetical protein
VVQDVGRRVVTEPGYLRDEAFCQDLVERTVWVGRTGRLAGSAGFQMRIWSGSATPGSWCLGDVARHDYYVWRAARPAVDTA